MKFIDNPYAAFYNTVLKSRMPVDVSSHDALRYAAIVQAIDYRFSFSIKNGRIEAFSFEKSLPPPAWVKDGVYASPQVFVV